MTLSYSDEDIVEIMVDIPDDDLESEEHKLEVLQEVKDEIAETGGVNYDLAITLETLMEGCISKQMPLRSFTKQHSLTNYNVAIEGIDKVTKYVKENILDKVVEAIKKLIQWLASLFARSGSSSDKPQKEKIAESVKNATRNDKRQKNETKREQDIAKRISRVDALSKTLVESIQKDMEGNAEFNSSGSDVEKTFMDIRKFYATVGLRGKFSPFIYQLAVKHDGSDLANATKLMSLLTEHISLVFIEIGAISKAIDSNQEFPPRQGFMPYERYNTILKTFKNVKYSEAENKGLPTVTEFKKGLYEYIKLDDTIKVENFDDVTWHGAASYFEGASQRMGEKFIEQVLHVNNIITKIQTKLKAEKDDATVGLYLPAIEMIKDEIAYITHVSSIIDLLEVACGNFANAYNKKVLDASRYFVQLFNNRVKKMEGLDNETKDKILEYVNAKDDKTASLESLLDQLDISDRYSYLYSIDVGMSNAGIESFASTIKDVGKKVIEGIKKLIAKLKEWAKAVWAKITGKNSDVAKDVKDAKDAVRAEEVVAKPAAEFTEIILDAAKTADKVPEAKRTPLEIATIELAIMLVGGKELMGKLETVERGHNALYAEVLKRHYNPLAFGIIFNPNNDSRLEVFKSKALPIILQLNSVSSDIVVAVEHLVKFVQSSDKSIDNLAHTLKLFTNSLSSSEFTVSTAGTSISTGLVKVDADTFATLDKSTVFFNDYASALDDLIPLTEVSGGTLTVSDMESVTTNAIYFVETLKTMDSKYVDENIKHLEFYSTAIAAVIEYEPLETDRAVGREKVKSLISAALNVTKKINLQYTKMAKIATVCDDYLSLITRVEKRRLRTLEEACNKTIHEFTAYVLKLAKEQNVDMKEAILPDGSLDPEYGAKLLSKVDGKFDSSLIKDALLSAKALQAALESPDIIKIAL